MKQNPPNAHRSQIKMCEKRQTRNVQFRFMQNAFRILKPIQKSSKCVSVFRNTGANAFAKIQMRLAYEDKRDLYCIDLEVKSNTMKIFILCLMIWCLILINQKTWITTWFHLCMWGVEIIHYSIYLNMAAYSTNHVYLHRPNAFGFWQTRLHLCFTKHSNAFRTFLNWLKNSKRVLHEPKLHISRLPLFAHFDLWSVSVWWV